MAVDLSELPAISPADISDDDLMLIFDNGAASSQSRKVTILELFADLAKTDEDADFDDITGDDISTDTGSIDELEVSTSLIVGNGDAVSLIEARRLSVAFADASASAEVTGTMSFTNALVNDVVVLDLPSGWPAGFLASAAVTASGVVTIRAFNATSSVISAASYSIKVVILRVA